MAAYGAEALMKALEKGRLKGKLKEIAAKLHPEDNPVVMVCRFKSREMSGWMMAGTCSLSGKKRSAVKFAE